MDESWVKLDLRNQVKLTPTTTVNGDVISSEGGPLFLVKFLDPLNPLLNYFEYVIEDIGKDSAIGLGVGEKDYSASAMPGWNANSCGYHADDGKLFLGAGMGANFAPTCTTGDRMGCGVEFDEEGKEEAKVSVFFTKNGQMVGHVVTMERPRHGLYPMIGLHSGGEKVRYLGHSRRELVTGALLMELGETHVWLRSNGIRFVEDGLTLEYAGSESERATDVGIAQSRYPLSEVQHYFELEILNDGQSGAIYIGAGAPLYPLHRYPGQDQGSVGYHGGEGCVYNGTRDSVPLGHTFAAGNRMGCGLKFTAAGTNDVVSAEDSESDGEKNELVEPDLDADRSFEDEEELFRRGRFMQELRKHIRVRKPVLRKPQPDRMPSRTKRTCLLFFTKDGEVIGETEVVMPQGGLYPLVAMTTKGSQVRVNFHPLTG